MEHAVTSCVKTNKPVNSGWSLENQGTGLQLTGRALHVLVVDDNRDAADSLCMLLRLWGYDCRVAYDGAAGLQAACDYTDNSHLGIHEASDIPIFTLSYLYSFASLHAAGLARSGRPVYVHWNGLANTRLK